MYTRGIFLVEICDPVENCGFGVYRIVVRLETFPKRLGELTDIYMYISYEPYHRA